MCCEAAKTRLVGPCAVRRLWRHGVFVARCATASECNRVVRILPAVHSRLSRVSTAGPSCTPRWCAARLQKALSDSLVGRQRSAAQGTSRACCACLAPRFSCMHYAPAAYGLQLARCDRLQLKMAARRLEQQFFMFWPQQCCLRADAPLGRMRCITYDHIRHLLLTLQYRISYGMYE